MDILTNFNNPELSFADLKKAEMPFTTVPPMIATIIVYVSTIFGLRIFMKNRERFDLKYIMAAHNFFLSGLSLAMFAGMMYYLIRIALTTEDLAETLFCDSRRIMARGPQNIWIYIFYLSKYYELIDTVIIVLKKRPLIFLHVYHHIITMVLVYVMANAEVAARWLPMVANCAVHVPMYYYYGISVLGHTAWWKKYITIMQITQFVVDLLGNSLSFFYYYNPNIQCSSAMLDWGFGQAILLSFLILFMNFFNKTYTPKKGAKTSTGEADSDNSDAEIRKSPSAARSNNAAQRKIRKED